MGLAWPGYFSQDGKLRRGISRWSSWKKKLVSASSCLSSLCVLGAEKREANAYFIPYRKYTQQRIGRHLYPPFPTKDRRAPERLPFFVFCSAATVSLLCCFVHAEAEFSRKKKLQKLRWPLLSSAELLHLMLDFQGLRSTPQTGRRSALVGLACRFRSISFCVCRCNNVDTARLLLWSTMAPTGYRSMCAPFTPIM